MLHQITIAGTPEAVCKAIATKQGLVLDRGRFSHLQHRLGTVDVLSKDAVEGQG